MTVSATPTAAASEPSDESLAIRAAAGDASAFAVLVGRYQHRVFRLACRLTSETDAADVLQETFLQVFRHLASFRGEARFGTWLFRIATNTCLMHRRSRTRRPTEPLDVFLPRFDGDGRHHNTPDELTTVAGRQRLARAARRRLRAVPGVSGVVSRDAVGPARSDRRRPAGRPACVARRLDQVNQHEEE